MVEELTLNSTTVKRSLKESSTINSSTRLKPFTTVACRSSPKRSQCGCTTQPTLLWAPSSGSPTPCHLPASLPQRLTRLRSLVGSQAWGSNSSFIYIGTLTVDLLASRCHQRMASEWNSTKAQNLLSTYKKGCHQRPSYACVSNKKVIAIRLSEVIPCLSSRTKCWSLLTRQ